VYVVLEGSPSAMHCDEPVGESTGQSELVEELRRTNELLREVITTRDEEIRRRDTIIMNMTEAMKALNPPAQETPSEARESPETVDEQHGRGQPHPDAPDAQEGVQRWWRKLIGR
jgi:K+/H+ antiporter YhaU regulatory subunit KhtT